MLESGFYLIGKVLMISERSTTRQYLVGPARHRVPLVVMSSTSCFMFELIWSGSSGPRFMPRKFETCPDWGAINWPFTFLGDTPTPQLGFDDSEFGRRSGLG